MGEPIQAGRTGEDAEVSRGPQTDDVREERDHVTAVQRVDLVDGDLPDLRERRGTPDQVGDLGTHERPVAGVVRTPLVEARDSLSSHLMRARRRPSADTGKVCGQRTSHSS